MTDEDRKWTEEHPRTLGLTLVEGSGEPYSAYRLEHDAATRYANVLMDEARGKRYPTVRRVMREALRWKPVKEEA